MFDSLVLLALVVCVWFVFLKQNGKHRKLFVRMYLNAINGRYPLVFPFKSIENGHVYSFVLATTQNKMAWIVQYIVCRAALTVLLHIEYIRSSNTSWWDTLNVCSDFTSSFNVKHTNKQTHKHTHLSIYRDVCVSLFFAAQQVLFTYELWIAPFVSIFIWNSYKLANEFVEYSIISRVRKIQAKARTFSRYYFLTMAPIRHKWLSNFMQNIFDFIFNVLFFLSVRSVQSNECFLIWC